MNKNKIMITGIGRCGSKMLHNCLSSLGMDLGLHEKTIGVDGAGLNFGWNKYITNERIAPDGYIQIGVVRQPLKCISSLTTASGGKGPYNKANEFFKNELRKGKTPLHKSMIYYYYVNNFLYNLELDILFNIEDLSNIDTQLQLSKFLPNITNKQLSKMITKYGNNYNTRKHINYTWEDLEKTDLELTNKIKKLSEKFGYIL